jgi:hypothetical protein
MDIGAIVLFSLNFYSFIGNLKFVTDIKKFAEKRGKVWTMLNTTVESNSKKCFSEIEFPFRLNQSKIRGFVILWNLQEVPGA